MLRYLAGAAAALFLLAGAGTPQAAVPAELNGVWRNPKNSVHVRIQPCGSNVCGTVVWASPQAHAKAREAGTRNLLGTQLFRQFRQQGAASWGGRVYVPDMGRTFSGSLRVASRNAVVARGCLIGRFLCKSQTWTRVS